MSGTTPEPTVNVTQLPVRTSTANTRIVGYDTGTGDYVAVEPNALRGLTGPSGSTGAQGAPGPQGATGAPGPQGIQGVQGPQGPAGPTGAAGRTILSGDRSPQTGDGTAGDFWIDTSTWKIHGPKTTVWPGGQSLIGPQGPQGPAGANGTGGGGSGTGNVAGGTATGQVPVWNTQTSLYEPQALLDVTADHVPTVELASATALTEAAHHRRNIVLISAAPLTVSAVEAAKGIECLVQNDTAAAQNITFASGITVKQPSNGTGTGGVVKVAADGEIRVFCYQRQGVTIAKVRGDVG